MDLPAAFLSDVHLTDAGDRTGRDLLALLAALPRAGFRSLYVLGDLFHYWVGPAHALRPELRPVVEAIRELGRRGVEATLVHGNRDFQLGPELGARLAPDGMEVLLDGQRVHLAHGDRFCLADTRYQAMRRVIRSGPARAFFRAVPDRLKFGLADALRALSRREVRAKPRAVMGVDPRALRRVFDGGAQVVICGHVHEEGLRRLDGRRVYTLGDWNAGPAWLEYRDGGFRFRHDIP
ncbi:MAG: UDP-2,3-diacylglucosamine diphosphatase [Planctomycetes bacterium]|nr:UDP-2,3-diacylglucosamine diphosphatase [Planctomycetota bacterium]